MGWGGVGEGGELPVSNLSPALRPAKTEETVSHRQNNSVKEFGTPPVRSYLCTPLIALSATARKSRRQCPKSNC